MTSVIIIIHTGVQVAAVCVIQWLRDGLKESGLSHFLFWDLGDVSLVHRPTPLLTTSWLPRVADVKTV